jgi:hypothetical protein
LQKNVEEWFRVINEQSRLDDKTVGVAITMNGRLEKIDWYGYAQVFHRLWPGLLRAAVIEALLEKRSASIEARPLNETRFQDLLRRLETVKPEQQRRSPQTLEDAWQFANCRVRHTGYFRTGTVAHTSVTF